MGGGEAGRVSFRREPQPACLAGQKRAVLAAGGPAARAVPCCGAPGRGQLAKGWERQVSCLPFLGQLKLLSQTVAHLANIAKAKAKPGSPVLSHNPEQVCG